MNEDQERNDYLDIKYDEKNKPFTDFPYNLAKHLLEKFKIKKGNKLLEIGCGRCEMLNSFGKLGLDISAVDISERVKNYVPKNISRLEILDITKEKLPFDDNGFDIIFTKSVIEHIHDPTHLMKEIYRILKPGGIIIVLTPDWVSQMNMFYEDPTHVHPYQPKGLEDLLTISGYKKTNSEIFYYHELLWKSFFWRFIAAILRKCISAKRGRDLTNSTKIKLFRWSVEKQILGYGYK